MYLEHYGLAEAPFRITPHTDFFFSGANRGATLEALLYAITHDEGIVKISGEVGSGKTMLCRVLMERLPDSVAVVYLANPALSRTDILFALADELGLTVPESSRASAVMRALQEYLVELYATGRQVVVLIDEAHAMPMDTLEEIRLLSNLESNRHKLLQLVLFGQPELDATLARADMRQLRERITQNFSLEPLVRDDIAAYLDFRMRAAGYHGPSVFAPEAIRLIAQASQGLTRRVNILADKALLASFAGGAHLVGSKEAKAAIQDAGFTPARKSGGGWRASLAGAAGGALVTLLLVGLWLTVSTPPPPPAATAQPDSASAPLATLATGTAPTTASAAAIPSPPPEQPPAKPTATPLLDRLLEESRPWIDSVAADHWYVQLYTTTHRYQEELAEKFLAQALRAGLDTTILRVYRTEVGDITRYGVIYGDFLSRRDAVKMLETLPADMQRMRPYPRRAIWLKPDGNTNTQN